MSYKTILVHLDGRPRCAARLELGFSLAEAFDAHVVGLFAPGAVHIPSYALAEAGPTVREIEALRRGEALQGSEQEFRAAAARRGAVKAEWRVSQDDALPALRLHARYSDLVLAGQPDPDEREAGFGPRGLTADLVLTAGRPVLVVPYAGRFAGFGRRVLVAWNGSREAARAVTDALPLLQSARSVDVVAFDPGGRGSDHGELPGADISLYLARHGVKASASTQHGTGLDVGAQILSRAADVEADLVVMGGYGHSRIRELVLGGVTRTLLESMTVPVLMSH